MTPASTLRRQELGAFLRAARERMDPASAGSATTPRRRTPGLRREEVASLAGVGLTWYTWLEQGRPINASRQVLCAVARALELTVDETNHVLVLADEPPLPTTPRRSEVTDEQRAVLDALSPNPAAIVDATFDVLAWNTSYRFLHGDLLAHEPERRNCLRLTFLDESWNSVMGDRDAICAGYVAKMRGLHPTHVHDPRWRAVLDDMLEQSDEFRRLWSRAEVRHTDAVPVRHIHNPYVGDLRVRSQTFLVPEGRGTKLTTWLPDDEVTAERIERLSRLG